jgi:formiminoglutamase
MQTDLRHYIDLPKTDSGFFEHLHRKEDLMLQTMANEQRIKNLREGNYKLAVLGVPEDRNSQNKGSAEAPDKIREKFYSLYSPDPDFPMIDLGNLKQGKSVKDTYTAVREVFIFLRNSGIIPVIIGGTQDLLMPIFDSYNTAKQPFNISNIDARFDLGDIESGFDNSSILSRIIHDKSPYLFNYTQIGYQGYYASPKDLALLDDLWFENIRLGEAQFDMTENEPYLRDSDFVCMDIRAVRQSDAPGVFPASVHGFYGEQACQLAKYAGLSDRLTGFALFETNPKYDRAGQTAELAAQIVWHFIQGVWLRKKDFPARSIEEYRKFIVPTPESDSNLIFYKNPKTGRWWMEIPYFEKNKEQKIIVACSMSDYHTATEGDVPDRWWRYYQKLSSASKNS